MVKRDPLSEGFGGGENFEGEGIKKIGTTLAFQEVEPAQGKSPYKKRT